MKKITEFTKNHFLFIGWVIVYAAVFLTLFSASVAHLDPDLGWHLRVGEDTVQDRQPQAIEKYTFPTLGQEWVDHEWLSNVIMYEIFQMGGKFGYWLLGISFSLLMLLTFHIIILLVRKYFLPDADRWNFFIISSGAMLVSTFSLRSFFGIRLQVLSWLFLALFFWIFLKIHKEQRYGFLLLFPLLSLFWANLHGSFVFGLAIFSSFFLFLFLFGKTSHNQKGLLVFCVIATFAVTLATPYNFKLWTLIAQEYTQNRYYFGKIVEWLPLYAVPYIRWFVTFHIALFVVTIIVAYRNKLLPKKIDILLYLLFIFLTIIVSIKSRRFAPFFVLSSFPVIVFVYTKLLQHVNVKKIVIGLFVSVAAILVCFQLNHLRSLPLDAFSTNSLDAPHEATSFLKNQSKLKDLNLLNNYEWGGYLDWTWPEKKIFVDGRMPQRPLDNGMTYLEEYYQFFNTSSVRQKLDHYDIDLVLTNADVPFSFQSRLEKILYKVLFMTEEGDFQETNVLGNYLESNWIKIYSDDFSVVFVRPSSSPSTVQDEN